MTDQSTIFFFFPRAQSSELGLISVFVCESAWRWAFAPIRNIISPVECGAFEWLWSHRVSWPLNSAPWRAITSDVIFLNMVFIRVIIKKQRGGSLCKKTIPQLNPHSTESPSVRIQMVYISESINTANKNTYLQHSDVFIGNCIEFILQNTPQ